MIDAYWDVDGKTMRDKDITVEQRQQRYAQIWNDFKDMTVEEYTQRYQTPTIS